MDFVETNGNLGRVHFVGSLPLSKDRIYKYPIISDAFMHNLGGTANFNLRPIQDEGFFVFEKRCYFKIQEMIVML